MKWHFQRARGKPIQKNQIKIGQAMLVPCLWAVLLYIVINILQYSQYYNCTSKLKSPKSLFISHETNWQTLAMFTLLNFHSLQKKCGHINTLCEEPLSELVPKLCPDTSWEIANQLVLRFFFQFSNRGDQIPVSILGQWNCLIHCWRQSPEISSRCISRGEAGV